MIDFADFDKITHEWEAAKTHAASLNRVAAIMEKSLSSFVEILKREIIKEKPGYSETKLRSVALADSRYEQYIVDMCKKREEAEVAYIHADALKMKFEAMRSANATSRVAMGMT
jgi:hypothetical protein